LQQIAGRHQSRYSDVYHQSASFGHWTLRPAPSFFHIVTVAIAAFLLGLGKYGGNDQSALFALMLFVTCFVSLLSPPCLQLGPDRHQSFLVFIDSCCRSVHCLGFSACFQSRCGIVTARTLLRCGHPRPLVRFSYQRRYGRSKISLEWQQMLGAICIGAGLVLAESLRQGLLIEEMAPKIFINNQSPPATGTILSSVKHRVSQRFAVHRRGMDYNYIFGAVIFLGAKIRRLDPQRYLALYSLTCLGAPCCCLA